MTEITQKHKILTISDHPLVSSGVGIQTRYIIEGLLKTGKYQFRSLGGAMKHPDYRPQKLNEYGDDWIIYPVDGYGNENILRQIMDVEKPECIYLMTDPRFYSWFFNMSDEIKDRSIPILYNHIWDNCPTPVFNRTPLSTCDFFGCISKLTHQIIQNLGFKENSEWIPHAADASIFKPFDEETIQQKRKEILGENADKFVIFYNSRNARRKMTSDVLKTFKMFLDEVGQSKAYLLMHTDPHDREGANLIEVAKMLELRNDQIAFSKDRIPPERMAEYYNSADVTINISNNEGFGLSCLESLYCGTLVIINKTGGLQDQPIDDEGNVFGVMIEPATKSLTGSQEIPYIFDDRCADKDIVDALKKIYFMSRANRAKLGKQANAWVTKTFSMERMISSWDKAFTKYIEMYKDGNPNRIRFGKI